MNLLKILKIIKQNYLFYNYWLPEDISFFNNIIIFTKIFKISQKYLN